SRGCRLGGPMGMTQSATTMPTTAPTVGPAIGAGLTDSMLGSRGSWRSRARAGGPRGPGGGWSGLDNTGASQQGRRVGLSRPVGRAMDLPVDESTSPATQGLQQALQQGAGGRLRLDLGGFW